MKYKLGDKVKMIGYGFITGIPTDMIGTVTPDPYFGIYSDSNKRLVNVTWANGDTSGQYKRDIEKV